MSNYKFTEVQIIDVWVSDIKRVSALINNITFNQMQDHFRNHGIRLEPGVDIRLMGTDFIVKTTSQLQEQIPEVKDLVIDFITKIGYTVCNLTRG